MSAMVDFPPAGIPHRKPLPSSAGAVPPTSSSHPHISHAHTRTASSNVFPTMSSTSAYPSGPAVEQFIQPTRRTLSNATTSTSSSGERAPPHQHPQHFTPVRTPSALRRSGSGRTTATSASSFQPTSYVALMRKQKATVWSERAQHEDPRLLAAQRQAKLRAAAEVVGGPQSHARSSAGGGAIGGSGGGNSSGGGGGGLRSKIRHHGATKATTYTGANMAGAGVPMRLSANEVDEGDSDDDNTLAGGAGGAYHRRTGSGLSSLGGSSGGRVASGHFLAAPGRDGRYAGQQGGSLNSSTGSAPSPSGLHPQQYQQQQQHGTEDDTPVPSSHGGGGGGGSGYGYGYLDHGPKTNTGLSHRSSSSGGSRENSFGQLAPMPERGEEAAAAAQNKKTTSTQDDLMRRGSVDERSMTMTGVRLFVANPDDDSD